MRVFGTRLHLKNPANWYLGNLMVRRVGSLHLVAKLTTEILMSFWPFALSGSFGLVVIYYHFNSNLALALLGLTTAGFFYYAQDLLLYQSSMPPTSRTLVDLPSAFGLPYEDVWIKTNDHLNINAYLILQPPGRREHAFTFLYFHGNAGNIGHRLESAKQLYTKCGINILLVDYRGYGRSQGAISEEGLYLDAQASLQFLLNRADINPLRIIAFGRSLGGAVAINLVHTAFGSENIAALIVENTFTSIPDLGEMILSTAVKYVPQWFIKNEFASIELVPELNLPALFLSGRADEIIPAQMMDTLFEACGSEDKQKQDFIDGHHNDTWQQHGYTEVIVHFLSFISRYSSSSGL